jgi:hypothetical protein
LRCAIILATLLICVVILRPVSEAQNSAPGATFTKTIQPFLAKHCYMCHNTKVKSGGLDLKAYQNVASILNDRDNWEHVLQKIRSAEMPPQGMPRPSKAEAEAFMRCIEQEFGRAERLVKPDPGRVTARRLNRAEYNNTVRDLLGVDFRPADDFPQDDSGYGFDNIGDVLSLSPVLMEKYLAAAEKIARTAIFGYEPLKPTLVRLRTSWQKNTASHTPLFDYDLSGLGLPNALHAVHRFPVDGEYTIRAFLGGVRPAGSEPLQLAFWVDGKQVQVIHFDPDRVASFTNSNDRQDFGGMAQDFRARFSAGEHWLAVSILNLYEGLPPKYAGPNPSKRPTPPPPEFKPPRNFPPEKIEEFRKNFEARRAEKIPLNEARISAVEIGGPYAQSKGASPESLKNIYACGHLDGNHLAGCERKIIGNLARRAFRRSVSAEEIDRLVQLVAMARKNGDSFEEGLCLSLQAILVSPHFLFRIEKDTVALSADNSHPISQHELASRLSYFLWSSMPDEELLGYADQGSLRKPAVLTAQVRRMLKDPRSRALVENFGGQWLELRRLESAKPDRELFPQFSEYLRMSMRRETELFFESIVREDRSIIDFINGNFTFVNEQLARFYHIPDVKGPEFRRVALTGETPRGGILTQASVLTVSSYATRTSPVLRGKWILENLLNAPPPPPPPDVPNLDESKAASSASLRLQLEEHRKNATCASCHARMDPLGFGLENFDAIGGWRAQDGNQAIDSSGTLPDGRSFKGAKELKAILQEDRNAFAECLTEKLLTYALGRGLERYDKPTVKKISGGLAASNYRFSSLVLEIVNSMPFQKRRGEKTS